MDMTPYKFQSFKDLETALLDFKDAEGPFVLVVYEDAKPEEVPVEEEQVPNEDIPEYLPPDEEPS